MKLSQVLRPHSHQTVRQHPNYTQSTSRAITAYVQHVYHGHNSCTALKICQCVRVFFLVCLFLFLSLAYW